jgi:hypothetical protein
MGRLGWASIVACAALLAPAAARPQALSGWRAARWGMTLEELLKAFPGEAARLDPPERLADGNVVAAGIDKVTVGDTPFRVRFVLDPSGGLALVSLRTDPKAYFGPDVFKATKKTLEAEHGKPTAETADDNFIDMRQVTWKTAHARLDLKYIPGVVVILHAAPSQRPAGPEPVRPELLEPREAAPGTPPAVSGPPVPATSAPAPSAKGTAGAPPKP